MPYKDKKKRYEAIMKSQAKKPEKYAEMRRGYKRKAHRKGYMLKRLYGITIDDYNQILARQNNACAICHKLAGVTKSGRCNLHMDHNHATNKARGLLCPRCNTLIGYMEQDDWQARLEEAEKYIEDYS